MNDDEGGELLETLPALAPESAFDLPSSSPEGWNTVEAKPSKRKQPQKQQQQQQNQQRQLPLRQRQVIGAPNPKPAGNFKCMPCSLFFSSTRLTIWRPSTVIDTSGSDSDQPGNDPSPTEYEPQWKKFAAAPQNSSRNGDPLSPTVSNGGLVWQSQSRARPRTKSTAYPRDYRMSRPTGTDAPVQGFVHVTDIID